MTTPSLTPASFAAKWKRAKLSERQASQEHFIDLCHLLGQPTPAEHDASDAEYAFEKSIILSIPGGLNLRQVFSYRSEDAAMTEMHIKLRYSCHELEQM